MKIEKLSKMKVAYMRSVGGDIVRNKQLMEEFKEWINRNGFMCDDTIILGIALDNPKTTEPKDLRYDVCLVLKDGAQEVDLETRYLESGDCAVFEVAHTMKAVQSFWNTIDHVIADLDVDFEKPILERYKVEKIKQELCEFCIPLK